LNEEIDSGLVLTRLGLAAFAFLVALPVLFWFCWLREMPIFWLNEGGYPVWLREMVLDTYYPIFFINLVLMFAYVVLLLRVPPRTPRVLRLNLAVLSVMAAGIIFAGICTVADNVLLLLS
jgi:hypothetical protein